MKDVKILYCSAWGYKPKAASLAARLKDELGLDTEITPGARGQFDVFYKGELVASKSPAPEWAKMLGPNGFPEEEQVIDAIHRRLG